MPMYIYFILTSNEFVYFYQGLGSPVFDKLEAELAKACMSLPATKGFEFGSGFGGRYIDVFSLHILFLLHWRALCTLWGCSYHGYLVAS